MTQGERITWIGIQYFKESWWKRENGITKDGKKLGSNTKITGEEAAKLFVRPDVVRLDPNQTYFDFSDNQARNSSTN